MKINVKVLSTKTDKEGFLVSDSVINQREIELVGEFVEMINEGFARSEQIAIILEIGDRKRAFYVYNTERGNCALSIYEAIAIFIEETKIIEEGEI